MDFVQLAPAWPADPLEGTAHSRTVFFSQAHGLLCSSLTQDSLVLSSPNPNKVASGGRRGGTRVHNGQGARRRGEGSGVQWQGGEARPRGRAARAQARGDSQQGFRPSGAWHVANRRGKATRSDLSTLVTTLYLKFSQRFTPIGDYYNLYKHISRSSAYYSHDVLSSKMPRTTLLCTTMVRGPEPSLCTL